MNLVICLVYVPVGENAFLFNFFLYYHPRMKKKKFQLLGTVLAKRLQKWTNYFKMFV